MSESDREKCSNCKYTTMQKREGSNELQLVCRRFPPQVFATIQSSGGLGIVPVMGSSFPSVRSEDWCGEWQRAGADLKPVA